MRKTLAALILGAGLALGIGSVKAQSTDVTIPPTTSFNASLEQALAANPIAGTVLLQPGVYDNSSDPNPENRVINIPYEIHVYGAHWFTPLGEDGTLLEVPENCTIITDAIHLGTYSELLSCVVRVDENVRDYAITAEWGNDVTNNYIERVPGGSPNGISGTYLSNVNNNVVSGFDTGIFAESWEDGPGGPYNLGSVLFFDNEVALNTPMAIQMGSIYDYGESVFKGSSLANIVLQNGGTNFYAVGNCWNSLTSSPWESYPLSEEGDMKETFITSTGQPISPETAVHLLPLFSDCPDFPGPSSVSNAFVWR